MRAMISGQRELQEGARWLARRGVAALDISSQQTAGCDIALGVRLREGRDGAPFGIEPLEVTIGWAAVLATAARSLVKPRQVKSQATCPGSGSHRKEPSPR